MTITIPTVELVGVLRDVVAFASPDKDSVVYRTVHLEWDGGQLHAMATDGLHAGWSRWHPDDPPPDGMEVQENLFAAGWGGDDAPWTATVDLDDAREAVKMFRLPAKQGWTPLSLECGLSEVVIARARLDQHTALTQRMRRDVLPVGAEFPDVPGLIAEDDRLARPVQQLAFTASRLAAFARVRVRGPLELEFTGPGRKVRARIGERFDGLILPVRSDSDRA